MLTGIVKILALAVAAASAAPAHLEPGSLSSPRAGGSYAAGSRVDITWIQAEYHFGNYTLWHSQDGGKTWTSIASWTGPRGNGVTVSYAWTVPDAPGSAHRVRVCQIGNCAEEDYVVVSGDFAIGPGASLPPPARNARPILAVDRYRNLEVSFELPAAGPAALKAYAADGSLRAVLLDGNHAAGSHNYRFTAGDLEPGEARFLRLETSGHILATLVTGR